MTGIKPLDYKILAELLRNSKVSDRLLARKLGKSQPTITRRRSRLEHSLIEGYTVIPQLKEIGFEIIALTFTAGRRDHLGPGRFEEAQEKAKKWLDAHPNVIFASSGHGMGWTGVVLSVHTSYSDYVRFKSEHDDEFSEYLADTESFLMDLNPKTTLKSFHVKYLADVDFAPESLDKSTH